MDVILNVDGDIASEIRRELSNFSNELNSIDDLDLQMVYFRYLHRLIPAVPRQILKSREFKCPPELQDGLNLLESKIKNGKSLTHHLSRKITKLNYNDLHLNAWGIQHLHLGTTYNKKGLIEGTEQIVFAIFDDTTAYFISIESHSWYEIEHLNIVVRNWPFLFERYRIRGQSLAYNPNSEQIQALRSNHANSAITLCNGLHYFEPGGGNMSNGTAMAASMYQMHFRNHAQHFYDNVMANPAPYLESFYGKLSKWPSKLELKIIMRGGYLFCAARNSRILNLVYPPNAEFHEPYLSKTKRWLTEASAACNIYMFAQPFNLAPQSPLPI